MYVRTGDVTATAILIVDDEIAVLNSLSNLLRDRYYVHATNDTNAALRTLQEEQIAVIITDQRMPKLTGAELLAGALEISPETTRILITGYSDIEAVIRAINKGKVYCYLTKPWDSEQFPRMVEEAVKYYQSVHERHKLLEKAGTAFGEPAVAQGGRSLGGTPSERLEWEINTLRAVNERLRWAVQSAEESRIRHPVCLGCGRVRDARQQWVNLLEFVATSPPFLLASHCPDCYFVLEESELEEGAHRKDVYK